MLYIFYNHLKNWISAIFYRLIAPTHSLTKESINLYMANTKTKDAIELKILSKITKYFNDKTVFCGVKYFNRILGKLGSKFQVLALYQKEVDLFCHQNKSSKNVVPRTIYGSSITDNSSINFGPDLERNCHRFVVANDGKASTSEKMLIESIRILPCTLEKICDTKIPVIGLYDNSSVILTHKKCLGYDFLKSWNGIYGKDLFMSFDQKKPKYFEEAWKKLEDKPSFVVFDFLKIMSKPPGHITMDENWGFTITKDANNPVLLEFDNFDGTRKAASPSFLMAVFIRKHLEAIRDENGGEKPTKIAFWIMNDLNDEKQFDKSAIKRIKKGLRKSCELLNVECSFINC